MKTTSLHFVNFIPYIIAICAGAAIVTERALAIAVGLAMVTILIGLITQRGILQSTPLNLPLFVLILLCGISMVVITPLLELSAAPAADLIIGVLLCMAWSQFAETTRGLGWLSATFALTTFASGIIAPFFIEWADKFTFWPTLSELMPKNLTGFSDTINANVAAGFFASLLAMAAGALIFGWGALGGLRRNGLLLLTTLLAIDLALTQSRSALFAIVFALFLLAALRWKWGWAAIACCVFVLVVGVVVFLGPNIVWQAFLSLTGGGTSYAMREDIWRRALMIISDFPLSGIGIATFPTVVATFFPLGYIADHAHNLYLQLAADLGLPGLVIWLGCFFVAVRMAWSLLHRRAAGALYPALGAAALGFNAVLASHGLLDCVLWDTRPAVLVWAVWGLTAAGWRLSSSTQVKP
jgi:putative inorganic carbon (hco3(-)) transporter